MGDIGLVRGLLDVNEERKARILHALDKRRLNELSEELEGAGIRDLRDDLVALVELRGGSGGLGPGPGQGRRSRGPSLPP